MIDENAQKEPRYDLAGKSVCDPTFTRSNSKAGTFKRCEDVGPEVKRPVHRAPTIGQNSAIRATGIPKTSPKGPAAKRPEAALE